jgi:hypothetical protein
LLQRHDGEQPRRRRSSSPSKCLDGVAGISKDLSQAVRVLLLVLAFFGHRCVAGSGDSFVSVAHSVIVRSQSLLPGFGCRAADAIVNSTRTHGRPLVADRGFARRLLHKAAAGLGARESTSRGPFSGPVTDVRGTSLAAKRVSAKRRGFMRRPHAKATVRLDATSKRADGYDGAHQGPRAPLHAAVTCGACCCCHYPTGIALAGYGDRKGLGGVDAVLDAPWRVPRRGCRSWVQHLGGDDGDNAHRRASVSASRPRNKRYERAGVVPFSAEAASGRRWPAVKHCGRLCGNSCSRSTPPMHDNPGFYNFDYDDLLRWVPTWVMLEQARLMLAHLSDSPTQWPKNAIYTHGVISAMRSFTLFVQKEFKHDTGFDEWYADVQEQLAADPEFAYLVKARNYVLHEGALMIDSRLGTGGTELRIRPARSHSNPELAYPPDRDLRQMLAEKIQVLECILDDAKERFPEADEWDWDPEFEAETERLTDETDYDR